LKDSPPIAEPVLLARPRGTHRFEAFSPKLARRLMFYRRSLLQHWLLLEADPSVMSCCERPGYVLIDGHRRLADFFVFYIDLNELVILIDQMADDSAKTSCRDLDSTAFPIRPVAPAESEARSANPTASDYVLRKASLTIARYRARILSGRSGVGSHGFVQPASKRQDQRARASDAIAVAAHVIRGGGDIVNRGKPELQAIDANAWPTVAHPELDEPARRAFETCRRAVLR
jgi:hypothetical protein